MINGTEKFGRNIYKGLTGMITKPISGAKKSGVNGFLSGVGSGVLGAISKPVGGALDFMSNTFEGISNTPKFIMLKSRMMEAPNALIRPSRFIDCRGFTLKNRLREYSEMEALALKFIREIDSHISLKKMPEEKLKEVEVTAGLKKAMIITNERIYIVKLFEGKRFLLRVVLLEEFKNKSSFENSQSILLNSVDRTKLDLQNGVIEIRGIIETDPFAKEKEERVIDCADKSQAERLYKKIRGEIRNAFPLIINARLGIGGRWIDVTGSF